MSVSPLPVAVWEARKVHLQSGLCHHCVMGEPLPDLTCVMSKVLKTKHVCTWVQSWDDLQWLMAEVRAVCRKCWTCGINWGDSCLSLGEWTWFLLTFAEVGLLKQASFVASWRLSFTPPFLAVGDYSFKRPEESWQETPGRTNRRTFDVEEAREGNTPLIVGKNLVLLG